MCVTNWDVEKKYIYQTRLYLVFTKAIHFSHYSSTILRCLIKSMSNSKQGSSKTRLISTKIQQKIFFFAGCTEYCNCQFIKTDWCYAISSVLRWKRTGVASSTITIVKDKTVRMMKMTKAREMKRRKAVVRRMESRQARRAKKLIRTSDVWATCRSLWSLCITRAQDWEINWSI